MDFVDTAWGDLLPFVAIGFVAQLVDGALGMAFGAIATTLLVGFMGIAPAQASYRVHIIKCFTTAVSGASHAMSGNIDKRLFLKVALPGVLGGVIGAYGLTQIDGDAVKPFVLAYLGLLGVILILKGIHGQFRQRTPKAVVPLGFSGGILDAIGGGGWGPVVSSGLMLQGTEPRKVVGSVNSAEFFVAVAISGAFVSQLGIEELAGAPLGLLIGGVLAAPLGAIVAKRLPAPVMLVLVGSVLSATTTYWLFTSVL
ncbi:sulfite exporter TauE/SafE family protein [Erythrobacter sp.]|uniref:sulfite exporter TauE/SafE family protein n=1 Tax=Erythrobacter sp. TaxID=1042 RepID=UPI001B1CC0F1|nr:sulfite exporter TauE/SafE family protein [Erythrobacter sp.]MBO6526470.1 sulfite exporter TauE/SafE family protein [Erythrobacter sp.]MBO6529317.1 sulfite exporter TauE/SafE family protein [Erythrobacter sp.]